MGSDPIVLKKTGAKHNANCAHSVCAISRGMGKAFGIDDYEKWMTSIKERIQRSRIRASMLVNSEQTLLYWDVGHEILEKQNNEGWRTKVVERMSADLRATFPDMKGWSRSNLMYMRQFAEAWTRREIVQAPLGQLPWYHHIALLECLKSRGDRIAYAALALENGWSRNVMVHQIELGTADLHGTAITNFKNLMPPADSDMAEQTLKGEYDLGFLPVTGRTKENRLRAILVDKVARFMVELGAGFSYVGKTIGILLCKSRNDVVAEYSLADLKKPIGVSTYRLGLPPLEQLKAQLRKVLSIPNRQGK